MDSEILKIQQGEDDICFVGIHSEKLYQNESVQFRKEMMALLEKGCRYLVLDLSAVRVMNSSAIGVVLLTADRIRKGNGKFAVGGLNPLLREMFDRMYLGSLFDVADTPEQASAIIRGYKKIPAI